MNYNPLTMKKMAFKLTLTRFSATAFGVALLLPFFLWPTHFALFGNEQNRGRQEFLDPSAGWDTTITLLCRPLAIELMPHDEDGNGIPDSAYIYLYASDLVDNELSNYPEEVFFSINRMGEAPGPEAAGLLLSCPDTGLVEVEVYGWLQDSIVGACSAEVIVEDNMNLCAGPYRTGVCGYFISFKDFSQVYDVQVSLSGDTTAVVTTDSNGMFCFFGLEENNPYLVTPFKDTDHTYNVSLFDIVLISKHILGIQPLGSPYELIAADVNHSRSVTGLDLIALRRLLLGESTGFPNNTSWRFIDPSYVFPDPEDPWLEPFPESAYLTARELFPAMVFPSFAFLAVKVGDVNGG